MARPACDGEHSSLPIPARPALRLARRLARAEARGRAPAALADAGCCLRGAGLGPQEAQHAALVLLGFGLRERGLSHVRVAACLRTRAAPDAAEAAALDTARIVRSLRPDLEPARLETLRRRAAVLTFLAFALWGALGAQILQRIF